jgi:hypothetical protein
MYVNNYFYKDWSIFKNEKKTIQIAKFYFSIH